MDVLSGAVARLLRRTQWRIKALLNNRAKQTCSLRCKVFRKDEGLVRKRDIRVPVKRSNLTRFFEIDFRLHVS